MGARLAQGWRKDGARPKSKSRQPATQPSRRPGFWVQGVLRRRARERERGRERETEREAKRKRERERENEIKREGDKERERER